jgi:hypothetical protein
LQRLLKNWSCFISATLSLHKGYLGRSLE